MTAGTAWIALVITVTLGWAAARAVRAGADRFDLGCLLLAWLARWHAPYGTHDINVRVQPNGMAFGALGEGLQAWGSLVSGGGDPALGRVIAVAPLAGALGVMAFSGVARAAGLDPAVRRGAALALALQPTLVWHGHTDAPHVPTALFAALGALALADAVGLSSSPPSTAWRRVSAVVAVMALSITPSFRPDAALALVTPLGLLALGGGLAPERRGRFVLLVAAAAALAVPVLPSLEGRLSNDTNLYGEGLEVAGWRHFIFLDPSVGGLGWPALLAVGMVFGRAPLYLRALLLAVALFLGAYGSTWVRADIPLVARHQLHAVPAVAVLVGAGLAATGPGAAVLPAALAWSLRGHEALYDEQIELRLMWQGAASLPDGCVVMVHRPMEDTSLVFVAPDDQHVRVLTLQEEIPAVDCVAYYRPGTCWPLRRPGPEPVGRRMLEVCEAFEARHGVRIDEVELPGRRIGFRAAGDVVVGWGWVREPATRTTTWPRPR